jgi:hypothetical protein
VTLAVILKATGLSCEGPGAARRNELPSWGDRFGLVWRYRPPFFFRHMEDTIATNTIAITTTLTQKVMMLLSESTLI